MLIKNLHYNAIEDCMSLCNLTIKYFCSPPKRRSWSRRLQKLRESKQSMTRAILQVRPSKFMIKITPTDNFWNVDYVPFWNNAISWTKLIIQMRSIVSCSQVRRFRTGWVVGQGGVQRAQDAAQGQHQPGEGEFTMMLGKPWENPNDGLWWIVTF